MAHARDLGELVGAVRSLRNNALKLTEFPEVLKELFGDRVVTSAIHRVAVEHGSAIKAATQSYTNREGILATPALIIPVAPAAARSISSVKPSNHTFYRDAP